MNTKTMTIKEAIDILEKALKCHAYYDETGTCPGMTLCTECKFYCNNEDFYEAIYELLHKIKEIAI